MRTKVKTKCFWGLFPCRTSTCSVAFFSVPLLQDLNASSLLLEAVLCVVMLTGLPAVAVKAAGCVVQ